MTRQPPSNARFVGGPADGGRLPLDNYVEGKLGQVCFLGAFEDKGDYFVQVFTDLGNAFSSYSYIWIEDGQAFYWQRDSEYTEPKIKGKFRSGREL